MEEPLRCIGITGRRCDTTELASCVRRDPHRLGRLGGCNRLPPELLGLAQVAVPERDRAKACERERSVVAEADTRAELERAAKRVDGRPLVVPPLPDPRLEQQ